MEKFDQTRHVSKRRSRSNQTVSAPRRSRRAGTWVAVVTIAAAAIVASRATRPRPSANEALPAAEAATSNRFLPTVENSNRPPGPAPDGMVWIPGGEFSMGAQDPPDLNDAVGMRPRLIPDRCIASSWTWYPL